MRRVVGYFGGSLATRLLALVLVPIVSLSMLGFQRIERENDAAARAEGVAEIVALQQAVAAAIPPAQVERIMLEGLARSDELGLPRDVIVGWTGVDFEGIYEANRVDLERCLDKLVDQYGSLLLADGRSLEERLGYARGALATQRVASDEMRAVSSDINRAFESLDAVLQEALVTGRLHEVDDHLIDGDRNQLDGLATALVSAGAYANAGVRGILFQTDETFAEVVATEATHAANLDAFAATLDADERRDLDAVRMLLGPLPNVLADTAFLSTEGKDVIETSTMAILGQMDYVAALQDYSDQFHEGVAARSSAEARAAKASASRTRNLLWLSGVTTFALIALFMWSTLMPIRRLSRRASRISEGDLAPEPVPVRGPRDIRSLTRTVNEMLSTLHRVEQEVSHLASGDVDEELTPDLPGAIGVSIRESVRNLSDVTTKLQSSEQLSSAIVAQAADAIWTLRADGTIKTANQASALLTGVPSDDQLGRPIRDFLSAETGEALVKTAPNGRTKVLVARSVIEAGPERVIAVIAHDISERSRFEDRLAYQASHDSLTGLPNRFAVLEHLEEIVAGDRHDVAILFVDLDSFKSVNDTRGHAAGDRVLVEAASRIAGCVRDDEFVGRLGGDEFVVVVHKFVQIADVVALGHRIIREIELPHGDGGQIFALSASVGVALCSPTSSPLDTIRDADNAVYQAKRRGRGRVEVFDASLQHDLDRLAELELALRQAIPNEELVVYLQPIVNLATGRIGGAEALVRWERPGHGLVSPNDFIHVAERSSLIFELERWVLTRVCERLAEWRRREPRCSYRVAVNISGQHLIEGDLLADVDAALSLTGADPTMLEIELTETQLLADVESATAVLAELRARGVTIAIDDFGTGYSSMTYLRHLPVDVIKIDRSFVVHATEDGYDSTVIEAMLSIGRTLNLAVVAEGVETSAQLDYVRARGCDRAQGFLFARPMPVAEVELILFESPAVTFA